LLNRVILQGRLTNHPELKHTSTGKEVTDFSIAVESNKKTNGERITNFFKIEAWNAAAEFICKYFEKGQQIIVEGRLAASSYNDKSGVKRKDVFVIVDTVNFCGAKSTESQAKDFEESFDDDIEGLD
jgi:single-strand DNA-binding protein